MQSSQLQRRKFIAALGGVATWPIAARAQRPATKEYRIAIASPAVPTADMREASTNPIYSTLFRELRRLGYVERENLVVDRYSAGGREDRLGELASEVVRTKPDLIVSSTSRLAMSFKAATTTIPVVAVTADPVAFGIVASLAHPGGNITGISVDAGIELWGKNLQLVCEAVPSATKVGFLASRQVWQGPQGGVLNEKARQASVSLFGPPLESPITQEEYRRVFLAMVQNHAEALIVSDQIENLANQRVIVRLAEEIRLPTVYPNTTFVEIGGLMAYGTDITDVYRRLAGYVDQILRGAKPGDTPFYLASKFELALNLRTAKALGIAFPTSLLVRADHVIE